MLDLAAAVASKHAALPALGDGAIIGAAILLIVGIIIWLMGAKLARPVCVISGLVLGGVAGLALGKTYLNEPNYVLPIVIGCAIIGALLAALLFRLWVALAGAVLLALVVPMGSLVWQGAAPAIPGVPGAATQSSKASSAAKTSPPKLHLNRAPNAIVASIEAATTSPAASQPSASGILNSMWTVVSAFYKRQAGTVTSWWNDTLSHTGHTQVYIGAAIGAAIGFFLGLIVPYIAASFESALAGAILVFFAGGTLWRYINPDSASIIPTAARTIIITVGLITILGFILQWTFLRRKTDK